MRSGSIWLDTARVDDENRTGLLFEYPLELIEARTPEAVLPALQAAEAAVRAGRWVAGFVSYEAAAGLLPLRLPLDPSLPLVWLGVYEAPLNVPPPPGSSPTPPVMEVRFEPSRELYGEAIRAIRHLIHEGDLYQVNFTGRLCFRYEGDPFGLYMALRQRQPVPYGAFLTVEDTYILSLSPELFFRTEAGRIWTRPMKGTARRGRDAEEDQALAEGLVEDEKNRAENLMIVDLLRNDLSRICTPGSVHVPALFATERHPTVTQMTSTVEGTLRPGIGLGETFRALFPCGSVTGAPKLRAAQRIAQLERTPRGVYCGAIGYAAPDGTSAFSVAIRTLTLRGEEGTLGVGSGVVWDSEAEDEWNECLLKAQFLTDLARAPVAS